MYIPKHNLHGTIYDIQYWLIDGKDVPSYTIRITDREFRGKVISWVPEQRNGKQTQASIFAEDIELYDPFVMDAYVYIEKLKLHGIIRHIRIDSQGGPTYQIQIQDPQAGHRNQGRIVNRVPGRRIPGRRKGHLKHATDPIFVKDLKFVAAPETRSSWTGLTRITSY